MFGMGFMEIFLVLIVAILALGPEKLPTALVDMAKFFKKLKGEIDDAKTTISNELDIDNLKSEANELKASISNIKSIAHSDFNDLTSIEENDDSDDNIPKKEKKKLKKEIKIEEKQEKKTKQKQKENKIKKPDKQNRSVYSIKSEI